MVGVRLCCRRHVATPLVACRTTLLHTHTHTHTNIPYCLACAKCYFYLTPRRTETPAFSNKSQHRPCGACVVRAHACVCVCAKNISICIRVRRKHDDDGGGGGNDQRRCCSARSRQRNDTQSFCVRARPQKSSVIHLVYTIYYIQNLSPRVRRVLRVESHV